VLDVFLARPDHLYRALDLLRDLHGPHRPSYSRRRPESTPQQVMWRRTCSRFRPVTFITAACVMPGICVPTQISQLSLVNMDGNSFIGSIVACARKGCSYTASIRRAALAIAAAASPYDARRAALFRCGGELRDDVGRGELCVGSGIHLGAAAARPCLAAHV